MYFIRFYRSVNKSTSGAVDHPRTSQKVGGNDSISFMWKESTGVEELTI